VAKWCALVGPMSILTIALALPASADHLQGPDSDNVICQGLVTGKLYGDGYSQSWQDQNHDGLWWDGGSFTGWQLKTEYWGLHTSGSNQGVTAIGGDHTGSPNVSMNARCPDSGQT
jgi:hypothetical protein